MVPESYRTVRSVFWSGGSRHPARRFASRPSGWLHPAEPSGVAVRRTASMEVSEIMSKDLVTVGPEYNVADVASLMRSRKVGSVIVLEDDRVLGILTERDILGVVGSGEDPKNVAAHEALTDDVITIGPDAPVEEAAGEMVRAGVRHLPVISEQGLIGIVSMRDLVRWSVRGVAESTDLPHIELSKQVLSLVHKAGK
jgi:CBS domain-containing protein